MKKNTRPGVPTMPTWCPGCGDFGIWTAIRDVAAKRGWDNTNTVIVAGIGCHGHIINFLDLPAVEGLHGRALPVASGIAMANPDLNIIVFTGDGDALAEGGNHFLHASRRNHNMLVVLHDNAVYGLTTGQTSPRSPKGYASKSTPEGNLDEPLHPLRLALAAGATFLARGYAGDVPRLATLIEAGADHRGFSVLQVLQPCVTFNKLYTHAFYQKNIYELPESHDVTNTVAAFQKTLEWGEKKIPVGIFYDITTPTHEDGIVPMKKRPFGKKRTLDLQSLYHKYG